MQLTEGINLIITIFIIGMQKLSESIESGFLFGGVDIYTGNAFVKILM